MIRTLIVALFAFAMPLLAQTPPGFPHPNTTTQHDEKLFEQPTPAARPQPSCFPDTNRQTTDRLESVIVIEVPAKEEFPAPSTLFLGPNLPCFTQRMTPSEFKWWAIEQNEIAYAEAARRRDEVERHGTAVRDKQVYGYSSGIFNGWNNLHVRESAGIYPGATPYGGGPVWIINPYCPPGR